MNWIIPDKLLAFSSPARESENGDLTPEDYLPIFRELGVSCVIRLNKPQYAASRFRANGIGVQDLVFIDGTCPKPEYIQTFIETVENESVVAVHCKAGLGRTATLIGCYVMKHYDITAREFIAWARICRPGSVLGP